MAAPDDEFRASLERNFTGIGCTMEAQTTTSNSTQCGLFTGDYRKYTVSGTIFSFKLKQLEKKNLTKFRLERDSTPMTLRKPNPILGLISTRRG